MPSVIGRDRRGSGFHLGESTRAAEAVPPPLVSSRQVPLLVLQQALRATRLARP